MTSREPVTWALLSHRAGESQQILGLAEAVVARFGGRLRSITPAWTPLANSLGLLRRSSFAGIDTATRATIADESPDLLITAGLRNEPTAALPNPRRARPILSSKAKKVPQVSQPLRVSIPRAKPARTLLSRPATSPRTRQSRPRVWRHLSDGKRRNLDDGSAVPPAAGGRGPRFG